LREVLRTRGPDHSSAYHDVSVCFHPTTR
jgi:hypothetical protein